MFSILGRNSGYYQFEIPNADRYKTIFSSYPGLLRLLRMPLGLKSAPALLYRAVHITLSRLE